jgi:hypothetical protein
MKPVAPVTKTLFPLPDMISIDCKVPIEEVSKTKRLYIGEIERLLKVSCAQ